jgi:hypothetical protein
MMTRTLATLTLVLALRGGPEPKAPADTHLDAARAAHRARILDLDDVGGCREAPPTQVAAAPAVSCAAEGQP